MTSELIIRMVIAVVLAFMLGSIPVSYLIGRFLYGLDPREFGSGATGATNSARSMGAKAGVAVALLDIAKGWVAITLCQLIFVPEAQFGASLFWLATGIALFAVVAGHAYSPWIGFKGGKGVAVAAGATLSIWPPLFFIELAIIVGVSLLTGYVSLSSVIAASMLPIWMLIFAPIRYTELILTTIAAAILVLWLHRENIVRLLKGKENKLTLGKAKRKSKSVSSSNTEIENIREIEDQS